MLNGVVAVTFLTAILGASQCSARSNVPNNPKNPGVKARLTKRGADYLKELMVKTLVKEATKVRNINEHVNMGQGAMHLQNVAITHMRAPRQTTVTFKPPKSIVLGLADMDIGLGGRFLGVYQGHQVPGNFALTLAQVTLSLTVDLHRNPRGELKVVMSNCAAHVPHFALNMAAEGPLAAFVPQFKPQIDAAMRPHLPAVLCRSVGKALQKAAKELFTELAEIEMDKEKEEKSGETTPFDDFKETMTRDLLLNMRLTDEPKVTPNYIEMPLKGELRYKNSSKTPFFPRQIPEFESRHKMIYIAGSDYIFKSLLYHSYRQKRLKITMTQEKSKKPKDKGFFYTTCRRHNQNCIGAIFGSIGENYPNSVTELEMVANKMPRFKISRGKAKLKARGRIFIYVIKENRRKQLVVIDAKALSAVKILPKVSNSRVKGEFSLKRLKLNLWRSSVKKMRQRDLDVVAPLAQMLLEYELNKAFEKGLPLPSFEDLVQYVDPEVQVHKGFTVFAGDFKLRQEKVDQMVAEALAKVN